MAHAFVSVKSSFLCWIGLVLVALSLGGCASPAQLAPGTTEQAALAALGKPTATWPLPDGGLRLQYSGQPSLQSVWNLDFDAARRLIRTEQMMNDAAFSQIRVGKTTRQDVLRDFGQPADVQTFALKQQTSFMYRYFTQGGFQAAMYVNFDPAGIVVETQTGLDPWQLGGPDRR
jgi:outer membrane protein assembly factor BamE (lipoprotein component of BamABCDE complex)